VDGRPDVSDPLGSLSVGYIPIELSEGNWQITYMGQIAPAVEGKPHPTFADADSAHVYIDLMEEEHATVA
jgi:hypothetical protein